MDRNVPRSLKKPSLLAKSQGSGYGYDEPGWGTPAYAPSAY